MKTLSLIVLLLAGNLARAATVNTLLGGNVGIGLGCDDVRVEHPLRVFVPADAPDGRYFIYTTEERDGALRGGLNLIFTVSGGEAISSEPVELGNGDVYAWASYGVISAVSSSMPGSYTVEGSVSDIHKTTQATSAEQFWAAWSNGTKTVTEPFEIYIYRPVDEEATRSYDEKVICGQGTPGMPYYNVHALTVSLGISDIPLVYHPPHGPAMEFRLQYNQREAGDPKNFSSTNFGRCWTSNWLGYVSEDPKDPRANVQVRLPGGGSETFVPSGQQGGFGMHLQSRAVLKKTAAGYERQLPDGSREIYGFDDGATANPRRFFLTQKLDAQGCGFALNYEQVNGVRLASIVDSFGRTTRMEYAMADEPLKPTRVVDPFGRSTLLGYNSQKQLASITDQAGMVSSFVYGSKDFIRAMSTPYGTTVFATGQKGNHRWLEITDPAGSKERVEFRDKALGVGSSEAQSPTGFAGNNKSLQYNNTFYWDKRAMDEAPGDYAKARIIHWLNSGDGKKVSGVVASRKAPLEGRIWYQYASQADPTRTGSTSLPVKVARLLDDGSTQTFVNEYNSQGLRTKAVDPLGRTRIFEYDGTDLVRVKQRFSGQEVLLYSLAYSPRHQLLARTEASGARTSWTYNSIGQVTSVTDALGLSRTFSYFTEPTEKSYGALKAVNGPSGQLLAAYSYDAFGRVATSTDADGRILRFNYDAEGGNPIKSLDRITRVTYPDGTFEEAGYKWLDLEWVRNRKGGVTRFEFDELRKPASITDPLGRITLYQWCGCGSLEALTDPAGHVTTWSYDLQGRVTAKAIAGALVESYRYEPLGGRVAEITDAMNQSTRLTYFADNSLKQISYANALHATAPVSFAYDPEIGRVTSMSDAIGVTRYLYRSPAEPGGGRLAQTDGPLSDDTLTFEYDLLGRLTQRKLNGTLYSQSYDSLGRLSASSDALGTASMSYADSSNRIQHVAFSNGMHGDFGYSESLSEPQLTTVNYYRPNELSFLRLAYAYGAPGEIRSISEWIGRSRAATEFTYDAGSQLLSSERVDGNPMVSEFSYDLAGNRISACEEKLFATAVYNEANQLVKQTHGEGVARFAGHVTQGASVTVNGQPATSQAQGRFSSYVPVVSGTNVVSITATGTSGATTTSRYQLVVDGGGSRSFAYDINGNLLGDGDAQTYEWDAANRLVAIQYAGTGRRTEFAYDGLGRMVRLVEKEEGAVLQESRFVWDGTELVQQRQADGITDYYPEGFIRRSDAGEARYYCFRDHLGSVRAIVGDGGVVHAKYSYAPFGQRTRTEGTLEAELGFTGYFYHAVSGLHLAPRRVYSAHLGRWLSRDPLGEAAGNNLYAYVENDPINNVDPLGLKTCLRSLKITYFGDLPSDKVGTRDNPLKPGDIAVGHFGIGQYPRKGDAWVLPFGTAVTVTPAHSPEFQGTVADVGAFDKKHPDLAGPSDWIDVWDPVKSKAAQSDTGWVEAQVQDGCTCPRGYLEVRRALPVQPVAF